MRAPMFLSPDEHIRVSQAVARAEAGTSGEIVTILAERSDDYTDVVLAWASVLSLLILTTLAVAPDFYLQGIEWLAGGWVHEWAPGELFTISAVLAATTFGATLALQMIPALRFALIPRSIKAARVHERALRAFRIGAEQRTTGRTGVLIYLSMREHRAEVLADAAIASKVDAGVWAEALEALLGHVRKGDVAAGMCAAVERIGNVLAEHLPRQKDDVNELPDRLIEV
ncbi:TPM domain-containing protein [Novosphingobium sp. M1R2S20]|uniref:TPM domain-containing protein n=1 Tax=Novosphingobium rhizovicinum TaxID=3228928 RepID=A0ABV3RF58_9SPHN